MTARKFYLLLVLLPWLCSSQRIDNTISYRDMGAEKYFRFHYDNDFFTATDYNYTQGYTFELVTPWLKKNPLNLILVQPDESRQSRYGIAFEQTGFTPVDITALEFQYGDRPYAATIVLKSFTITTDAARNIRLSSAITLGMIGPAALGNEMQTSIHKWIDDDLPQGWKHQIKNDLILDYELALEKQLLNVSNIVIINSHSKIRVGTLNTYASTGLNMTFGLRGSPNVNNIRPFQAYIYVHPVVSAIAYDATLQGGMFNKNSPYTIASSDLERIVLQNNFGAVIKFNSVYLEYSRAMITREFASGHSHKWGGFRVGFTF